MSIKSKMMDEINKKAQKIKENRLQAATNKNAESYVFEYINQIEEINHSLVDETLKEAFRYAALESLRAKVRTIDNSRDMRVEVVKQGTTDSVQGVLIQWSDVFQKTNQCSPETYIDVSQLLFS